MTIKELSKLLILCRKHGVEKLKLGDVEFSINPSFLTHTTSKSKTHTTATPVYSPGGVTEDIKIETEELTHEQLLFYSAGSDPQ